MLVFDRTCDRTSMESLIQLPQQWRQTDLRWANQRQNFTSSILDLHRREVLILASYNSTPAEHHRVLDLMESGIDGARVADVIARARSRWRWTFSSLAASGSEGGKGCR